MAAELIHSTIKLSIGILVSNRIETIRKCMESLVPLLKQVPSELIALDTVGEKTDGSIDVVKEYTDKVYPYEWCRDFADARNTCLSHVSGEWFLFLDDDEWFDNVEDLISFFQTGENERYQFGMFHVRNHHASGNYSTALVTRMIRRREDTHFEGKVHEHFHQLFPGGRMFKSFLHHSGYAFADEEAKKKHQERNVSILKEEIAALGMSSQRCAQMVQELLFRKETAKEGYDYCMQCLPLLKEHSRESCMQWMLIASVRYFHSLRDYDGMLGQIEYVRGFAELSQAAELALYGVWVHAAVEAKDYQRLPELAEKYLGCYLWLQNHPEQKMAQTQMDFAKYQETDYLEQVLQAGAIAANAVKDYKTAYEFWNHMPWKELKNGQKYQQALQETLQGMKNCVIMEKAKKEDKEMEKEIIVSISLLVSNRIDTIRKCMESLKPLLDAVPSELIAVDTVGEENSDGSLDVVREYTDQIVHFSWCNDFSAARNAGLLKARGKWFLTIDDDEWFEDISPIIQFFKSGDYKNYDRAWYYVRNYHNFAGTEWVDTFADRMCAITKETKYEGRVHECLQPYPKSVMQFFCYAHHYGYCFHNEEERKKHSERNCSLLKVELKEHPEDARLHAQLVQEYAIECKCSEAAQLVEEWLKKNLNQLGNPYVQWSLAMWLRVLIVANDMDAAAELMNRNEQRYKMNEMARLVYQFEGIKVEMAKQNYEGALRRIENYLELKEKIVKGGSTYAIQQVFDFKKYLEEKNMSFIINNGLVAMANSGQCAMAKKIIGYIDWSSETHRPYDSMLHLVELYGKTGRDDLFFPYAEQIVKNPGMKNPFMVSLDGLVRDYPERRAAVQQWLDRMSGKKPAVSAEMQALAGQIKNNIRVLLKANQPEEAKKLFAALCEIIPEDKEMAELREELYERTK